MISVVCVFNNSDVFNNVLLRSLRKQTVVFELIAIDNCNGEFGSAAQALNHGGSQASGEYIMFAHQDMWLDRDSWLEEAERIISSLPALGVAGVAGVCEEGKDLFERRKSSLNTLDLTGSHRIHPVQRPEIVQTLDECLLIVPRRVFAELKFDPDTFDGWDCYGADYCLSAARMGLQSYVIPLPCWHSCLRSAGWRFWEFRGLQKYQRRLLRKHGRRHKTIYTWLGTISWSYMKRQELSRLLMPFFLKLFPDMQIRLRRELSGCESVLDLGCGYHSPIAGYGFSYSVGVEISQPTLNESRRRRIHNDYVRADVRTVQFKPKSFDAVVAARLLEHLTEEEGLALIGKMQDWAIRKVIITTPNGYLKQHNIDENPARSGWTAARLRGLGFQVRGEGGWRKLREDHGGAKYRPAFFWERICDVTERLTYYVPGLAFQFMAVKTLPGASLPPVHLEVLGTKEE